MKFETCKTLQMVLTSTHAGSSLMEIWVFAEAHAKAPQFSSTVSRIIINFLSTFVPELEGGNFHLSMLPEALIRFKFYSLWMDQHLGSFLPSYMTCLHFYLVYHVPSEVVRVRSFWLGWPDINSISQLNYVCTWIMVCGNVHWTYFYAAYFFQDQTIIIWYYFSAYASL